QDPRRPLRTAEDGAPEAAPRPERDAGGVAENDEGEDLERDSLRLRRRLAHARILAAQTHALFRISPTPPAPGTMYWWSSSPFSSSQRDPGTLASTSGDDSPRSRRSA